jgi:hypothetical protein
LEQGDLVGWWQDAAVRVAGRTDIEASAGTRRRQFRQSPLKDGLLSCQLEQPRSNSIDFG